MNKLILTFGFFLMTLFSSEGAAEKLEALLKKNQQYLEARKAFALSEEDAWGKLVKAAEDNDKIIPVFTRRKPWIINGRYFFPREEGLKKIGKKFRESGVYVDGKSGKVEVVDTDRKIVIKHK